MKPKKNDNQRISKEKINTEESIALQIRIMNMYQKLFFKEIKNDLDIEQLELCRDMFTYLGGSFIE